MSFYDKIKDQVTELTNKYNYQNDGTAFGHFAIKECFNKIIDFEYDGSNFDDFIKAHIVDMSNDLGNDAVFTNQKNNEILIFQFKYSNSSLLNNDEIKKNKKFIDWLLNLSSENLSPNNKLQKIIDEEISPFLTPENIQKNNYNITFYYIDNNFDDRLMTDIKALFTNYNEKGINYCNKFYSYEEVEELYDDIEIPKNDVLLNIVEDEFFIKKSNYFDDSETPIETMITSLKVNSLKPIIEEKKELILALNVRYYKGENEINAKIKNEYSKGSRSNFWILNNGINAICENFELINKDKLRIKNFQIVNGGQTTKTLTRIVNELSDDVQLLMRLSKINDKTRISKISKDIAVASNSQNAISSRDLHSGDGIQVAIFKCLDEVGIFYDKKDGEWATVNKKKYRNPFGKSPMHLKIKNTELGISYLSFFLQMPISTKGRNKLVFSDIYYDDIFSMTKNQTEQFYKLIFSYRLSEKINKIKSENIMKFEILQNNYINDVILSLSAAYFFKDNYIKISKIAELIDNLNNLKGEDYILKEEKYCLNLNEGFEEYILKIIKALQIILDVKKEAKIEYANESWLTNDTNKWLKKDGTYKEIYQKVIKNLKQES